ncbi:hypothetical protein KPP03845_200289 (plasmid) [Streptomyces xanthophaeus]|nr:hypothetical protein KPP03845_200289 [Streptomyces xanthophaeus]
MKREHLDQLLADSSGTYGAPCQQAFAGIARTHRGGPAAEIVYLLSRAADRALVGVGVRWSSSRRGSSG